MSLRSDDLTLDSSTPGVRLAGTLSRSTGRSKGLVLLLSGSGALDRDESVSGQRPFLGLREGLAARGYAALSWDDRGIGGSSGDYQQTNGNVLVADAMSVMSQVVAIEPASFIAVAGHSQGANIATRVAVESPDVNALLLLAGSGRPGRTVLLDQHVRICHSLGVEKEALEQSLDMKSRAFDVLEDFGDDTSPDKLLEMQQRLRAVVETFCVEPELSETIEDLMEWEWRFLLRYDAGPWLRRIRVPCLAAAGDKDVQIDAQAELGGQCHALGDLVTARLFPGLNHLFQHAESGSLDEYESLGAPFPDAILDELSEWLDGVARSTSDE